MLARLTVRTMPMIGAYTILTKNTQQDNVTVKVEIQFKGFVLGDELLKMLHIQAICNGLQTSVLSTFFMIEGIFHNFESGDIVVGWPPGNINTDEVRKLFSIEDKDIPEQYICPITKTLINDPVILRRNSPTHQLFEKIALIQTIIQKQENPLSRLPATIFDIIDAPEAKQDITDFIRNQIRAVPLERFKQEKSEKGVNTHSSAFFTEIGTQTDTSSQAVLQFNTF